MKWTAIVMGIMQERKCKKDWRKNSHAVHALFVGAAGFANSLVVSFKMFLVPKAIEPPIPRP